MNLTRYLSAEQRQALEFEVISVDLRAHLTRLLGSFTDNGDDPEVNLIKKNRLINWARTLLGEKIYVLESDDWGHYEPAVHAWHYGEFELLFRRLNTLQFVEFLGDLIERGYFDDDDINVLLETEGLSFRYEKEDSKVAVQVLPLEELEEITHDRPSWSQNIRLLIDRMEGALISKDYGALLHASASVFETLAKEVVATPGVQNQTLGGFFARYRQDSGLPAAVLDYVLDLYNRRNSTPLAGHGSTNPPPALTEQQAVTLAEMTKGFVRIEYRLKIEGVTVPRGGSGATAAAGTSTSAATVAAATSAPGGTPPTGGTGVAASGNTPSTPSGNATESIGSGAIVAPSSGAAGGASP